MKLNILIRGSNDVASATAYTLFHAGYAVFIHDIPQPTVTRRKMAFADAVFDGTAMLNGLEARLVEQRLLLPDLLAQHEVVPVVVGKLEETLRGMSPEILVDARMRKHHQPEAQLALAPLTIGLGPNFVVGHITHLAIETGRGEHLGQIVRLGAPQPLQGEPNDIGGHGRDRYVYAPRAGIFQTSFQPGDPVARGQEIARIDHTPLFSPLAGVLRGITHNGVPVVLKNKVIEVDPRGAKAQIYGIAERPAKIAQGVLQAVKEWEEKHAR